MTTHVLAIVAPDDLTLSAVAVSVPVDCSISAVEIESAHEAAAFLWRFGRWAAVVLNTSLSRHGNPLVLRIHTDSTVAPKWEPLYEIDVTPMRHRCAPAAHPGVSAKSRAITTGEAFALEDSSIHHAPDVDLLRSSRYFRALDSVTSPALIRSRAWPGMPSYTTGLTGLIRDTSTALYSVFRTRFESRARPRDLPRPVVLMLGAIQTDILRLHLASGSSPANVDIAHGAYASFGTGELLLHIREGRNSLHENLANGGPNGVFIFLFAEFALQAIKQEIDRETWRILLPGMAAACELFLLCYGPIDSSERILRHDASYYTLQRPARRIKAEDRLRVLHRYRPMSIEEIDRRLTELARGALLSQDVHAAPNSHLHAPPPNIAIGFNPRKAEFPKLPWLTPKASGVEFADPT